MANSGPLEFAKAVKKFTDAVPNALREAVRESALFTKRAIVAQPDFPRNGLRGTARRGKPGRRVSVTFDVKGTANPTALVQTRGPMPLIEFDVPPHKIGARNVRKPMAYGIRARRDKNGRMLPGTRRYRIKAEGPTFYIGRKTVKINGAVRRGPFDHPGTRGKHVFESGVKAAERFTPDIFKRHIMLNASTNLAKTFK